MKALIIAGVMVAGLVGPAAAFSWAPAGGELVAQGPKGRDARHERAQPPGRDFRPERRPDRDDRRERLNEDERRALHRDLDKASRELYQRRFER